MKEIVTFVMFIILWVLMAGAFISAWRLHRRKWAGLTTRFIEIDFIDNAWICEECGVRCEGYRYCPNCGRKIVEFVRKGETE